MSDHDPATDQTATLNSLRPRFVESLAQNRAEISQLRHSVEAEGATLTALNAIGRIANHVTAVAQTFGFSDLGIVASELDLMMNGENLPWHSCELQIDRFEQAIDHILADDPSRASIAAALPCRAEGRQK